MKKILLSSISFLTFLLLFFGLAVASDVKKEIIRFSSDTAHIKKRDGILHLSGGVKITYGQYVIKSDLLMAKTLNVDSPEIKIIEARKNISAYLTELNELKLKYSDLKSLCIDEIRL